MIELAYTSVATWDYTPEDLADILTVSRANNAKHGITGILLYRGKTVLQLLEGEAAAVRSLYAKLLLDKRHHSISLLYDRPLAARIFGKWSMGFEQWAAQDSFDESVHRITLGGLQPALEVEHRAQRLIDMFVRHVR